MAGATVPGGTAPEAIYRPILRAQRGELAALAHLDPGSIPLVTPILVAGATNRGPARDTYDFGKAVAEHVPPGLRIGVDLGDLSESGTGRAWPGHDLAGQLSEGGVEMLPVIRLTDGAARLGAYGDAARRHAGRAILRLRPDAVAGPAAATRACDRIWRRTGLLPDRCDLVIDLGALTHHGDLGRAEPVARRMLAWAADDDWWSVTVAAGAMPASLSHLATNVATRLPRWEAELWRRLADLPVDYGDYGVTTALPGTDGRQLPTMRYTTDDAWWVYRWSRHGGRTDDRLHDLYGTLTSATHWSGAALSWGDREIARRARFTPGPGTPTSWIAWATSHHLAHLLAALRRTGPFPDPTPTGRPHPVAGHTGEDWSRR